MFRIIQRYIGASFILPFLVGLLFFVSFMLTFQMFRVVKLVINKGVPITVIAELLSYIAVSFIPMAVPLSVLFSAIFVMNRLSNDSEFMAMRSFGLSKFKIFFPFLLLGVVIAWVTFSLNQSIIPKANGEFKKSINVLTSKGLIADIKGGNFFSDIPGVTLFAENVIDKGRELDNVFIHMAGKSAGQESIIFAERGELIKMAQSKWGHAGLRLKLSDGNIIRIDRDKSQVEKILFKQYEFPIVEGDLTVSSVNKDSVRTNRELRELLALTPEQRAERKISDRDMAKTKVELLSRYNTPITSLVFVLLGFVLGIQNTRGKSRNTALLCGIILAIYYALYFTLVSLATAGKIPPEVATFLPATLGLFVGAWFYRKLEWVA